MRCANNRRREKEDTLLGREEKGGGTRERGDGSSQALRMLTVTRLPAVSTAG